MLYSIRPIGNMVWDVNDVIDKKFNNDLFVSSNYNNEYINIIIEAIDFRFHTNIILFGLRNVVLIEAIYAKLSKESTLIIADFEDSNGGIIFEGNENIFKIFTQSNVSLLIGSKDEIMIQLDKRMKKSDFVFNGRNIHVIKSPYIDTRFKLEFKELSGLIKKNLSYMFRSFGNDIDDTMIGIDHTFNNMKRIIESTSMNELRNSYLKKPAIIISAGPSLDKNIHLLKEYQDNAVILSVDSSFNKLNKLNIVPDCIATIERPEVIYDMLYKDFSVPKESVFIGPTVVHHSITDLFERVLFLGREADNFGKSLFNRMGRDSIELGVNCAHVCFAFAKYLGCDPIIFVGQDLAYTNGLKHHKDISYEAPDEDLVKVLGRNGEMLDTTQNYFDALVWFENQIDMTPEVTFVNATEGGAKIKGTLEQSFADALCRYCVEKVSPLKDRVSKVNDKNIEKSISAFVESTDSVLADLSDFRKIFVKWYEMILKTEDAKVGNIFDAFIEDLKRFIAQRQELIIIIQPLYIDFMTKIREIPFRDQEIKELQKLKRIMQTKGKDFLDVIDYLESNFELYFKIIDSVKGAYNV